MCFAIAVAGGWGAGLDLMTLLHGFTERRPVIASSQFIGTELLLLPMVLSVGVVLLFSKEATPEEMKRASERSLRWAGRYVIFLAASIVAAKAAPIPQYLVVSYLAQQRGYVPCPMPDWPRHQPDRWALPGPHGGTENCPGRGADPNS